MKRLALIVATFGGAGYFPKAPGTAGSLFSLPFALAVAFAGGFWALCAFVAVLYVAGVAATSEVLEHSRDKDPSFVVIDEACGQSLALLPLAFCGAMGWPFIIAAFALFRFFDITKPWPASYFDKKVRSARGVMLDDVAAGIYAAAAIVAIRFLPV